MLNSKKRPGLEDLGCVLLPNECTHRLLFSDQCCEFECMLSVKYLKCLFSVILWMNWHFINLTLFPILHMREAVGREPLSPEGGLEI